MQIKNLVILIVLPNTLHVNSTPLKKNIELKKMETKQHLFEKILIMKCQ